MVHTCGRVENNQPQEYVHQMTAVHQICKIMDQFRYNASFPFDLYEWLASHSFLQYHPGITPHEIHENKWNDHQLKKLLIVKQILLLNTVEKHGELYSEYACWF